MAHECRRSPLDGIAPGLAMPFARGDVTVQFGLPQALESHYGGDHAMDHATVGRDHADPADNTMAPSGQHLQAGPSLALLFCLGQDAPAASHHRIGCQNKGIPVARRHFASLGFGEAGSMGNGKFAWKWRLVNARRIDQAGNNADLGQQIEPPR